MTPKSVIYTRKLTERNFTVSILIHGSGGSRHSDKRGGGGLVIQTLRGEADSKSFFHGPLGLSLV